MNGYDDPDLRLQDITAKLSGVKLMQTVRVLRTLPLVLEFLGRNNTAAELHDMLAQSAHSGEYKAPLHAKPLPADHHACLRAAEAFKASYPNAARDVERITKLENDPYYDDTYIWA